MKYDYISKQTGKRLSNRTIINRLLTIKTFTNWLWEEDYITDKEYKKIKRYKNKEIEPTEGEDNRRALTETEILKGYQKVNDPLIRMLFWVGLNYGIRREEYTKLTFKDIDLKNRLLSVHGKGNKIRRIKILEHHVKRWEDWLNKRNLYNINHDYVFFTSRGKASTKAIDRYFKKINHLVVDKNKSDLTSHSFRYTFAVNLWRKNVDLLVIQRLLGHVKLETTKRYLRVEDWEIQARYEEQMKVSI